MKEEEKNSATKTRLVAKWKHELTKKNQRKQKHGEI